MIDLLMLLFILIAVKVCVPARNLNSNCSDAPTALLTQLIKGQPYLPPVFWYLSLSYSPLASSFVMAKRLGSTCPKFDCCEPWFCTEALVDCSLPAPWDCLR